MKAVPVPIQWHAGLSVYASEGYLSAISPEYGWLGGCDDAGTLRCILPYTILRKVLLRMVRFTEDTMMVQGELAVEEEKRFLDSVVAHFRTRGLDMIIPSTNNAIFRTYPTAAEAAPYCTYTLDLQQSEEALWLGLHSKHRNVIRNAQKKGVQVVTGVEHLEAAYTLVRDTLKRSGEPCKSYKEFECLVKGLGKHVAIFMAQFEGKAQGCAIVPFSTYSAHYLYGGSIPLPLTGALNYMQWEIIRHFRQAGVRYYDLVGARIDPEPGSKQEGIKRFKERFGGRLVEGYLWRTFFRSGKRILYCLAASVRGGGDIVTKEGHKLQRSGFNANPG